jgi:hypothetical protein
LDYSVKTYSKFLKKNSIPIFFSLLYRALKLGPDRPRRKHQETILFIAMSCSEWADIQILTNKHSKGIWTIFTAFGFIIFIQSVTVTASILVENQLGHIEFIKSNMWRECVVDLLTYHLVKILINCRVLF